MRDPDETDEDLHPVSGQARRAEPGAAVPRVVAVTADRRRHDQALLLERHGFQVEMFPLLQTTPAQSTPAQPGPGGGGTDGAECDELLALTARMADDPPGYLVANTGYGMRSWFASARSWGLLEDLVGALGTSTVVVARGAKALGELRKVGLDAAYKAPGETMAEVVSYLSRRDLAGSQVALQLHGDGTGPLAELSALKADVVAVPVYTVSAADGAVPAQLVRAIVDGNVNAVTFTAAPQLQVLESHSRGQGTWGAVLSAFNARGVLAACIGEVCAGAARQAGIASPLVPAHPRLASLVGALATRLSAEGAPPDVSA